MCRKVRSPFVRLFMMVGPCLLSLEFECKRGYNGLLKKRMYGHKNQEGLNLGPIRERR